jgi:hypothetical protein
LLAPLRGYESFSPNLCGLAPAAICCRRFATGLGNFKKRQRGRRHGSPSLARFDVAQFSAANAAKADSRGHQPTVIGDMDRISCEAATARQLKTSLSPLRGFCRIFPTDPWANAQGYLLSSLRD